MASNPQEQQQQQQQEHFSAKISDDINCSVCLDILVRPQTLVPCGHSFCRSCCCSDSLKNGRHNRQHNNNNTSFFTNCPHCRQTVESVVPSRQLESLIDTLRTVPNLLNEDDKQHYLERMKKENERSTTNTKQVSARTRKRQRQNGSHSQNYDFTVPGGAQAQLRTAVNANSHNIRNGIGNTYHARHGVVGVTLPSSGSATTTTTRTASSYDPMLAPLPPPYEFTGAGPVPALILTGAITTGPAPDLPRSSRESQTAKNASGISASDAICID